MKRMIIPVLILLLLVWNGSRINEVQADEESAPAPEENEVVDSLPAPPAIKEDMEASVPVYTDTLVFQLIPGDSLFLDVDELRQHFEKVFDFMASFDVYKGRMDDFPYCPEWALTTWDGRENTRTGDEVVLSAWTTSVDFRKSGWYMANFKNSCITTLTTVVHLLQLNTPAIGRPPVNRHRLQGRFRRPVSGL